MTKLVDMLLEAVHARDAADDIDDYDAMPLDHPEINPQYGDDGADSDSHVDEQWSDNEADEGTTGVL